MSDTYRPLVSIVVPTYNEEDDIARTMEALAALDYDLYEVLVVDKSQDRTPQIVMGYAPQIARLRLVPQGEKRGVSVARNVGLREAQGEIVVILNADVLLPPDFLARLIPHYEAGADYVCVNSRVLNTDSLYPRYIQAQHEYKFKTDQHPLTWTEGYSCRRDAALAVGGFPEDFSLNTAGEDVIFGDRMKEKFRGKYDYSIVVPHLMPTTFRVYWRQRLGRGRGGAYMLHVYEGRPMRWWRVLISVVGSLALTFSMILALLYARRLTAFSPRGRRDWLPFAWARFIELVARALGYLDGCLEIGWTRWKAASP